MDTDIFQKRKLRIATQTLRLSDAGAIILGGMTKEEAREILKKEQKKKMEKIKEKNLCGKTRNVDNPYEVWEGVTGWTWKILKKYQRPGLEAKNPAARWYCAVTSPYTPDEDC